MITKINLKNWRSHLDSTLEFSEGTNALIGIVGAGKTSVLDAICFGLFGTFPNLNARKIKLEDVVMKKPVQQKKAEVTLNINLGGNEYVIKRIIEGGRATGELKKNGKHIEGPQTQRVTEEIEKLLKINYDLFTRAVYSEQNQVDMFLTIPKGQRMKKIDELLSIDKFEKARKNVVSVINKCFSTANEKKKMISSLETDGNLKNITGIRHEIEAAERDKKRITDSLKNIHEKRMIQENKLKGLKETEKRIAEINEGIKTNVALLSSYRNDIDNIKDGLMEIAEKTDKQFEAEVEAAKKEYDELKKAVDEERTKFLQLQKSLTTKSTQIKMIEEEKIPSLKKAIEEMKKVESRLKRNPIEKLTKNINNMEKELEQTRSKINKSDAKIEEIKSGLEEMKTVENRCPVCDQSISIAKKNQIIKLKKMRIAKFEKIKKDSEKMIGKIENGIIKLKSEMKEAEKFQTQVLGLTNLEKDLKNAEINIQKLKSETKNYDTEVKMMEKTIDMLEKQHEQKRNTLEEINKVYDKKKQLLDKSTKMREAEKKINMLQSEKARFVGFAPEIIPSIEKELKDLFGMEKSIETKIENIDALTKERKKLLEELEKKEKILESYQQKIKKLEISAEQLHLFEASLESTQNQLRKNFITAVNLAMDEIWEHVYPYKDFYSCKLGVEDDYVLQLQDNTGWINVDGVVSGGERSIACLVLRMAFSLVLAPQLRWLVLDEPTHNLDARTVEDLSTLLRDRIPEMVEQVFIITHDPALESAVSGYLYRLERDKQQNESTRIIKISDPKG